MFRPKHNLGEHSSGQLPQYQAKIYSGQDDVKHSHVISTVTLSYAEVNVISTVREKSLWRSVQIQGWLANPTRLACQTPSCIETVSGISRRKLLEMTYLSDSFSGLPEITQFRWPLQGFLTCAWNWDEQKIQSYHPSLKSRHFGLSDLIRTIFLLRRHFLISFSLAKALWTSLVSS